MMVVGVLNVAGPQSAQPNENSTILGSLEVKGQVYWFDDSCHLLECQKIALVLLTFVDLPVLFLLPRTLVSSSMVPTACSSQDFAK